MGGFFLIARNSPYFSERGVGDLNACFRRVGFTAAEVILTEEAAFGAYPNFQQNTPEVLKLPGGDFVFVSGTCISNDGCGLSAARRLYDTPATSIDEFVGHYAIVMRRNHKIEVILDKFGGYHLYYNKESGIISTCWYALASLLPRLTVARQAVFEYVFNGVISGNDTLVSEICLAPIQAKIGVQRTGVYVGTTDLAIPTSFTRDSRRVCVRNTISILDDFFVKVVRVFEAQVGSALSGGYDSRLMLAFLRRHGVSGPRLYVYGHEKDADVQVACRIAAGEELPLEVIDKDCKLIDPEMFLDTVYRNFLFLDGYGHEGVFNNGVELSESARRVQCNRIAFNGGGGEILRNFFFLSDRAFSVRELLWTFYSQFDPACTTQLFDAEAYYRELERKVLTLLRTEERILSRPTIEWLYHNFRCRAWDGKVDSIANRFGHTAMPFLERRVTEHASVLRISWKQHGAYEAEVISSINQSLANYPSTYRHGFNGAPPLQRRIGDYATEIRPPWLRRYSYRIKHRLGSGSARQHRYLSQGYREAALPGGPEIVQRLFRVDKVRDPRQYARILSLEYAFRQFGSRLKLAF